MVRPQGSVYEHVSVSGRKTWKVEVEVGKKPDGSRRRIRRTARSLKEAHELRRELLRLADEQRVGMNPSQLFGPYAEWWVREIKSVKVRTATASDYEHRLRKHIQPVFSHRKLGEITARDVTAWMNNLSRGGYSSATVNGALQVLKAIFRFAHQEGLIAFSPVSSVPRLARRVDAPTQVREPLNADEARRLLSVCTDEPTGIGIVASLLLGLRRSEVLGLKWSDIDLERGIVRVQRGVREVSVYDAGGGGTSRIEVNEPKTASSRRQLSIPDGLLWRLKSRRIELEMFGNYEESHWVVSANGQAPMRPRPLSEALGRALRAADVRKIRFHDLRHSAATLSLAAGARIEAVSQILGHSGIEITKKTYAPYVAALSAEFSEAMGRQFPESNSFLDR